MSTSTDTHTGVFLEGDPCPIETNLSVEQVAAQLHDALQLDEPWLAWVRLPSDRGDALVRPRYIVAILPGCDEDDE